LHGWRPVANTRLPYEWRSVRNVQHRHCPEFAVICFVFLALSLLALQAFAQDGDARARCIVELTPQIDGPNDLP